MNIAIIVPKEPDKEIKQILSGLAPEVTILVLDDSLDLSEFDKVILCGVEAYRKYIGGSTKYAKYREFETPTATFGYAVDPASIKKDADNYVEFYHDINFHINPITPVPVQQYRIAQVSDLPLIFPSCPRLIGTYDIETTGRDINVDTIRRIGIRIDKVNYLLYTDSLDISALKEYMENPNITWVVQNGTMFDRPWMKKHFDIETKIVHDVMLLHYLLDERQGGHSLDDLAAKYLHHSTWKTITDYATVDDKELDEYLAIDLYVTDTLWEMFYAEIQEEGSDYVYEKVMIPGANALGDIQTRGVKLDTEYLQNLGIVQMLELETLQENFDTLAGHPVNINSPQQVSKLLYEIHGLPKYPNSKSSDLCTDAMALETCGTFHDAPVIQALLKLRRLKSCRKKYVEGLLELVDADGRIRPSFHIGGGYGDDEGGTRTGRLSCSKPNLQNIPASHHEWYTPMFNIKDAFVADEGYTLIEADYSQIELRVAAMCSRDPFLINAYKNDEDVHTLVGSRAFAVPVEKVTKLMRQAAKKIDFGVLYCIGKTALAEQIAIATKQPCTDDKADSLKKNLLLAMQGFSVWMKNQRNAVLKNHCVTSLIGRVRHFPCILPSNKWKVQNAAVNTPVQNFASDLTIDVIIEVEEYPTEECHVLLTVHDSILFQVRDDLVENYIKIIRNIMEHPRIYNEDVPLKADFKIGKRYGSMSELSY